MSISPVDSLLKTFGRLHGLERSIAQGGFLIRGIILAAPLLPIKFLAIYTGLCFLTAAILEVPAGYVSDRFSYLRNFYLALFFGLLSDLTFLIFVFSLLIDQHNWSYFFCGLGALFSGFNGALASGNNEVLFANWYTSQLKEGNIDEKTAPNLFLGALWPGLKTRAIALLALFAISFFSKDILWTNSPADVKIFALYLITGLISLEVIYFFMARSVLNLKDKSQLQGVAARAEKTNLWNWGNFKERLAIHKSWGSLLTIGTYILLVQILGVFLTSGAFRFLQPLLAKSNSGHSMEKWFVVASGFATTLGVAISSAYLSKKIRKERASFSAFLPNARWAVLFGVLSLSILLKFGSQIEAPLFGALYFILVVFCCTVSIACIGLLMWDFFTRTKVPLPATWLSIQSVLVSVSYFAICQIGVLFADLNVFIVPLYTAGLLVFLLGFIPRKQFGFENKRNV